LSIDRPAQVFFPKASSRNRQLASGVLLVGASTVAVFWSHPAWEAFLLLQPSTCLMKIFVGIPCLACRGTRAALALSHGHLNKAFTFNPLATLFLIGLIAYLAQVSFTGRLVQAKLSRPEHMVLWILFALALAVNWIYVICQGG
jgi:hypothetical protein